MVRSHIIVSYHGHKAFNLTVMSTVVFHQAEEFSFLRREIEKNVNNWRGIIYIHGPGNAKKKNKLQKTFKSRKDAI